MDLEPYGWLLDAVVHDGKVCVLSQTWDDSAKRLAVYTSDGTLGYDIVCRLEEPDDPGPESEPKPQPQPEPEPKPEPKPEPEPSGKGEPLPATGDPFAWLMGW